MPPSPPSLPPHALQAERALAAIEAQIRRHPSNSLLEALADAYLSRPIGHRLDNLNRALATYRITARSPPPINPALHRARLSAKLASTIFLRLRATTSLHASTSLHIVRVHLRTAINAVETAIHTYEQLNGWHSDQSEYQVYLHALLCRGLVYDSMYETAVLDAANTPEDPEKSRAPTAYLAHCIHSLEKALAIPPSPPDSVKESRLQSKLSLPFNAQPALRDGNQQLQGLSKARAILCLARAYVNADVVRPAAAEIIIKLLAGVDSILDTVKLGEERHVLDSDELAHMRTDAREKRAALESHGKSTESRCLLC